MPEPVLALSAAIVRLVSTLHTGPLSDNPGTVPGAGMRRARPGPAPADFLEVSQDYGHPVCFAKMIPFTARRAGPRPVRSRTRNNPARTAKTARGDLVAPVHASTFLRDMVFMPPVASAAMPAPGGFRAVRRHQRHRRITTCRARSIATSRDVPCTATGARPPDQVKYCRARDGVAWP